MEIIAHVYNDFKEKFGIPRQSGRVKNLSKIVFESKYRVAEAFTGLDEFNYLWIIFDFSLAHRNEFSPTVRPPRLGGNKRVGVFATRSPFRPNNMGLSSVKLVSIEKNNEYGTYLVVEGADLLDGTPVYDIKPYLPYCDCHTDAKGGFAEQFKEHKLIVEDPDNLLDVFGEQNRNVVIDCIAEDPCVSYKTGEISCGMRFGEYNVIFTVSAGKAIICRVEKN